MTKDFRRGGLIINERPEEHDGTTAVVREGTSLRRRSIFGAAAPIANR